MNSRLGLSTFLLAAVLSLPALAASVDSIQGKVSINRGSGFKPLNGSTEANAGDQVMASPGGSANIVYPDGCVVKVDPGTVVTVQEPSPCKAGGDHPARPYIIGAAIVGGAVGIAVVVSNNNNGHKHKNTGNNGNGGGGGGGGPQPPGTP